MKTICMLCKVGLVEGDENDGVSHGLCDPCSLTYYKKAELINISRNLAEIEAHFKRNAEMFKYLKLTASSNQDLISTVLKSVQKIEVKVTELQERFCEITDRVEGTTQK